MTAFATVALLVSTIMLRGHDEMLHGANAVTGQIALLLLAADWFSPLRRPCEKDDGYPSPVSRSPGSPARTTNLQTG
jgi:hypothetical protein